MTTPWPTDPAFRKFAATIADACMWWMHECERDGVCPLGAVAMRADENNTPMAARPSCANPLLKDVGDSADRFRFMLGFDSTAVDADHPNPYVRLGAAYRARFGKALRRGM